MGDYFIQETANGKLVICKVLAEYESNDKQAAYDQLINLKTGYLKEHELGKSILKKVK